MTGPEFEICCSLKQWIDLTYPNIKYRFDLGGIRVPIGLAKKIKMLQQGRGWPDLTIMEPFLLYERHYCGLVIEVKKDRSEVYRKDGKIKKKITKIYSEGILIEQYDHIQEQLSLLLDLRNRGFRAEWGFGYDHAKDIIINSLGER